MDYDRMHSPEREQEWIKKYREALNSNPTQPSRLARARAALWRAQQALVAAMKRRFAGGKEWPVESGLGADLPLSQPANSRRKDVQREQASTRSTDALPSRKQG